MEDMEIVIKIPKSVYDYVKQLGNIPTIDTQCVANAIFDGTLIDLKGLKSDMKALNCGYPYGLDYLLGCLDKRLGIKINESEEKK